MDGRFLFAAALGIALALGLQTALTGLAVAWGVFRRAGPAAPARAIGLRLGLRSAWGACLSAFAAAWIAARSLHSFSPAEGLLIGCAIWAGFLAIMSLSETAGRTSWFGTIMRVFRRSMAHFPHPRFPDPIQAHPSALAKIEAEAREAFRTRVAGGSLREALDGFLDRLGPQGPNRFEIEREANALFDDEVLRETARRGDLLRLDRGRFREMAASRNDFTAEEVAQWTEALHARWVALLDGGAKRAVEANSAEGRAQAVSGTGGAAMAPPGGAAGGKPLEAAGEMAGAATAVASGAGYRERLQGFKDFLRKADRSALNPDRLERELAHLVTNTENGQETVEKEARSLRRDDVARELKQRRDISPREADSIADLIDSARARMLSRSEIREHRRQEATDQALARLRDRLYSLSPPERDYAAFNAAIGRLLDERLASAPSLENELAEFDKASLQSLFASKPGISRADAGKMAEIADAVFRASEESTRRLRAEIVRRRDEVRLAAEAEEAASRSLAASSARWLLAISALSAVSAAFGGWLGARN
jgi:hypothetical protein